MADPVMAAAAVRAHAASLDRSVARHSGNASRCKQWAAALVALFVFLTAGKPSHPDLLWAMAPVALLALADACEVALARIFTDAYNRFMQRLPLNGGNAVKAEDAFPLPPPELGWRQAGLVLRALGSFSVWPFYGALMALVVAFYLQASHTEEGSARLLPSAATRVAQSPPMPSQGAAKASLPMKGITPMPTASRPGQTPPPGVRFPPLPQNRLPATHPAGQITTPGQTPDASGKPAPPPAPAISAIPVAPIQGAGAPGTAIPAPNPAPAPSPAAPR